DQILGQMDTVALARIQADAMRLAASVLRAPVRETCDSRSAMPCRATTMHSSMLKPSPVAEKQLADVRAAAALPMAEDPTLAATIYRLLILNLLLQVFDGVATYNGVSIGMQEANPLLRDAFALWGMGLTLLLSKSLSCAVLLVLYWRPAGVLVAWGFALLAVFFTVCSFVPSLGGVVSVGVGWR